VINSHDVVKDGVNNDDVNGVNDVHDVVKDGVDNDDVDGVNGDDTTQHGLAIGA
jgi:hypothetical protein